MEIMITGRPSMSQLRIGLKSYCRRQFFCHILPGRCDARLGGPKPQSTGVVTCVA